MNNCKNLESIPSSIGCLNSLKKLDLSGCSKLKNIPENLGEVESLEELDVSGTSIRQPPASIFLLKNLKVLSCDGCERIAVNPTDQVLPSLSGLCSLEVLDLCACNLSEGALPEDIGCLSSLRSFDLSRNKFVSLPTSINQLSKLEMLDLEDCRMLESLPEVPSKVQTVNLSGCIRLKNIPDPIKLNCSKRSEFICLNCWELCHHNGQDSMGLTMLERYIQGSSNPRPGFGIAVPGNEIPAWFNHQGKGSSITVQMPSGWMGIAACVAFSADGESRSLVCHFKANGRENYPSPMCISCNSIRVMSDHLWLFYLSFDYLKELKEWQPESFSNVELSFHSYEHGVNVKNCGVRLLYSPYTTSSPYTPQSSSAHLMVTSKEAASDTPSQSSSAHFMVTSEEAAPYTPQSSSAHFIVTSKETASSYRASLAFSSSYHQWMGNVFLGLRGADTSNAFTRLNSDLALGGIIPDNRELEKVMAIRSRLLEAIEESGLFIIIFARDWAHFPWCLDELVKIVGFMDEMRSDTVFPVSYDVKQSKIDDQTESYTIVFDKDEENFSEERVQKWMNILNEVAISFQLESLQSFGSVYQGTLEDGREVAIKRAEISNTSPYAVGTRRQEDKGNAFVNELELLSRLHHKNLVRLLGFCEDSNERLLVYEYMHNGTLHDHLHKLESSPLMSWVARIKVALDAARGVEYLHEYAVPPIIHRDIKSSNILLDSTWTAKVFHLGLSLMGPEDDKSHLSLRAAGTVGYIDPEYYRLQQLTPKSDVYSFGVVLLEMLSGSKAIHKNEIGGRRNVVDFVVPYIVQDEIHRVLDSRVPPPTPFEREAVMYIGYLAADCVSLEGRDRPSMTDVVNSLERALAACLVHPTLLSRSTSGDSTT